MNVVLVFAVLGLILFLASYVTKRRFGLLGLALAAGAILSTMWDTSAGLMVSATGLVPKGPLTDAVTLSLLVLLPPIVLLFHGTTYKSVLPRIIGSLFFAILALAFLVVPLGHALPLSGFGAEAYEWLDANRDLIISVGLVFAVIDLFFTKPVSHLERKAHRH